MRINPLLLTYMYMHVWPLVYDQVNVRTCTLLHVHVCGVLKSEEDQCKPKEDVLSSVDCSLGNSRHALHLWNTRDLFMFVTPPPG